MWRKIRDLNFEILELWFFRSFLFILPFQLRYIFATWNPPAPISVISATHNFNEWTSGFFYISDILLAIVFVLWLRRSYTSKINLKINIWPILLIITAGLSFFQVDDIYLAFFRFIKLSEAVLLFYYVKDFISTYKLKSIINTISYSLILQAILALMQIILQHNVGLWFLGEGYFYPGLKSVAAFKVGEDLFLRAYGTFQHPNVLAFFGLTNILIIYKYLIEKDRSLTKLIIFGLLSGHWLILASFSRTIMLLALVTHFIFLCIYFFNRNYIFLKLFTIFISFYLVLSTIFYPQLKSRLVFDTNEEAYQDRVAFSGQAINISQKNHNIGIGIGHSVYEIIKKNPYDNEYNYQPAHNVFLLVWLELGVIGLFVFCAFIFSIIWQIAKERRMQGIEKTFMGTMFVLGIVSLGFFDHYQWTLHQGVLMYWLFLAMF